MTFGMMFGSAHDSLDEWSTDDEEDDGEYNDCDDDEEYDDDEDEDDESFDLPYHPVESSSSFPWEPQAKQYSNMNLKDQVTLSKQKLHGGDKGDVGLHEDGRSNGGVGLNHAGDTNEVGLTDAEKEKKLKLAKKRAEKRRKQKERRLKEHAYPDLGTVPISAGKAASSYDPLSTAKEIDYTKESISLTKSSLIKLSADAGFNQQELKR